MRFCAYFWGCPLLSPFWELQVFINTKKNGGELCHSNGYIRGRWRLRSTCMSRKFRCRDRNNFSQRAIFTRSFFGNPCSGSPMDIAGSPEPNMGAKKGTPNGNQNRSQRRSKIGTQHATQKGTNLSLGPFWVPFGVSIFCLGKGVPLGAHSGSHLEINFGFW